METDLILSDALLCVHSYLRNVMSGLGCLAGMSISFFRILIPKSRSFFMPRLLFIDEILHKVLLPSNADYTLLHSTLCL